MIVAVRENMPASKAVARYDSLKSLARPPISDPVIDASITADVCMPSNLPMFSLPKSVGMRSMWTTGSPPNARNLSHNIVMTGYTPYPVRLRARKTVAVSREYRRGSAVKIPNHIVANPHAKAPKLCKIPDMLMTSGT
ncbi:MAG: hypothetical protein QXH86_09070 [Ignisphaera sp.]